MASERYVPPDDLTLEDIRGLKGNNLIKSTAKRFTPPVPLKGCDSQTDKKDRLSYAYRHYHGLSIDPNKVGSFLLILLEACYVIDPTAACCCANTLHVQAPLQPAVRPDTGHLR